MMHSFKFHVVSARPGGTSHHCPLSGIRTAVASATCSSLPPDLAVRLAVANDLPALVDLEDTAWPGGNWDRKQVEAELDRQRAIVLVADVETDSSAAASPVGWLAAWRVPPDELHVLELAVSPHYRRKGVASALLRHLFQEHGWAVAPVASFDLSFFLFLLTPSFFSVPRHLHCKLPFSQSHRQDAAVALLEVRAGSIGAIALYEKEGFVRVGLRKGYYRDGEDAVLMNKEFL
jgi:[ribosomal protein S18]-alanine N-acetyltransferase